MLSTCDSYYGRKFCVSHRPLQLVTLRTLPTCGCMDGLSALRMRAAMGCAAVQTSEADQSAVPCIPPRSRLLVSEAQRVVVQLQRSLASKQSSELKERETVSSVVGWFESTNSSSSNKAGPCSTVLYVRYCAIAHQPLTFHIH